jgi:DNA repair protein RadC
VRRGCAFISPQVVRDFLRLKLGALEHEVFAVLLLDAQNRLIDYQEMFRGTVTQTSVYPREVVKEALARNAAAAIFAHNHPSGVAEPSHADETLTRTLKQALGLVDVRVLDHFIVAGDAIAYFAECGRHWYVKSPGAVRGAKQAAPGPNHIPKQGCPEGSR